MKVLQLIDSLHAGGAERVAVTFANALSSRIDGSFLCTTREEGILKDSLSTDITYLFLNKKSTLDLRAIKVLSRFIKVNQIDIVHTHATSFFLGTLIKILNPKVVLVWHDHYGKSGFLASRPSTVLKICSLFFDQVLCVNTALEQWSKRKLKTKSVCFFPNFAVMNNIKPMTTLKGAKGKRIVCLANLRPQKDHLILLEAFMQIKESNSGWTLHLVGHDFNDSYSKDIRMFIKTHGLEKHVFFYGSCSDTFHILNQASIGVLSSKSEGLPLALLEYGLAGLPVVATDVGDCKQVVLNQEFGELVAPSDPEALADALLRFMGEPNLRNAVGNQLQLKVKTYFSETEIMQKLVEIYDQNLV